jgi:hypothetical protein
MTDEQVAEFFEQWSSLGDEARNAWLAEIEQSGRAAEWGDVLAMLAEQDEGLAQRLVGIGQWHADAPRRNAQRKRRKTQEPGLSWQRALAAHVQQDDAPQTRLAKFRSLPRQHEEPLTLGQWEVWRDSDDRIWCTDATGKAASVSFATFERYLKEKSA